MREAKSVKMAPNKTARIARPSGQQKFQLSFLLFLPQTFLPHFSSLPLCVCQISFQFTTLKQEDILLLCSICSKCNIKLFSDYYILMDVALGWSVKNIVCESHCNY